MRMEAWVEGKKNVRRFTLTTGPRLMEDSLFSFRDQ
jgi:hypothetical protein